METVNIHAAKTNLSKLIEKVEHGEEIIISRAGKPVARLLPCVTAEPVSRKARKLGKWEGKIWISPDFNAPDPELESLFDGPLFPGKR